MQTSTDPVLLYTQFDLLAGSVPDGPNPGKTTEWPLHVADDQVQASVGDREKLTRPSNLPGQASDEWRRRRSRSDENPAGWSPVSLRFVPVVCGNVAPSPGRQHNVIFVSKEKMEGKQNWCACTLFSRSAPCVVPYLRRPPPSTIRWVPLTYSASSESR